MINIRLKVLDSKFRMHRYFAVFSFLNSVFAGWPNLSCRSYKTVPCRSCKNATKMVDAVFVWRCFLQQGSDPSVSFRNQSPKKNPTEPSPGMVTYREFRVFWRIIKARLCFPETQNFKVRKCTPRIFENHVQLCIIPTQQSRFFDCSCSYPLLIDFWPSFLALLAGICV